MFNPRKSYRRTCAQENTRYSQRLAILDGKDRHFSGHLHNHVGLTENFDQSENEEFLVNDSP